MKIKLISGVIVETDNPDIVEQYLKYGGKEVKSNKGASKGSKSSENKEA
jgi:hypothetical protein|nr:MAG TPA: hypothetical protein [Caudoviricetes sp.]